MVNKGILIFAVILTLLASAVLADETTQLYSRILVSPFYRDSLTQNVVYNYTLSVAPPDGLTQVYSALIYWQVNMIPTLGLTMKVNNQTCNTPTYNISTTYAGTSQVMASFDCSNIIIKAGNYSVTLTASRATGAITGWLDLTYTNKPLATMELSGTEYQAGDDGTIFLLLKDANGIFITNATCTLDIYQPLSANSTHPEWINNGLMMYLEEGLYYYDFIAPLYAGIYMVNAQCTYVTSNNQYYTISSGLAPTRNATTGTYTGDPFVLDDYGEWLYTQCDSGTAGGGGKACTSDYTWNMTAGGLTGNVTQLFVQYLGENNGANLMLMSWFNWSETNTSKQWVKLPNNITFTATASSGVPIGVDEYLSNALPLGAISPLTRVRVRINTTSGSTFKQWDNFIALKAVQYRNSIQDLKGSGEIHVSSSGDGENRFFRTDTCDGYMDGRCGLFTNDDEFDLVEGEIEDYFNISASSTRSDVPISYQTPFSVDCTAIYWIKEWNGTAWVDFTDYITYSQPSFQNCIITLYKDITSGTQYQFWLKMDNYMSWEVEYTKQIVDSIEPQIEALCADRNFTYETPITETTTISNDTITDFCHRSYDDFYYISSYYNDSLSVFVSGEYASYLQEMRFYRQELFNRYDFLVQTLQIPSIITKLNLINASLSGNLSTIYAQLLNISNQTQQTYILLQQVITLANSTIYPIVNNTYTYLTNTIYPYLQQIWNKLLGIETQLNTTINITNSTLNIVTDINSTTALIKNDTSTIITKITDLNISMQAGFAEKDAHIQDAYNNMTSQVQNLSVDITQNFNTTWVMIESLNTSQMGNNSLILSYLQNITLAINTTQTQLSDVNQSLSSQIANASNTTNTLITNLNISDQARFDQLQSYLVNLTIQISNNQNMTQANFTQLQNLLLSVNLSLTTDITNLNTSLYDVRNDLLVQINQSYQYMVAMNNSILNQLLNLSLQLNSTQTEIINNLNSLTLSLWTKMDEAQNRTDYAIALIENLSLQVAAENESNQDVLDYLSSMNLNITNNFNDIGGEFNYTWELINNSTQNVNFTQVLNAITNLSTQVSSNQNITQQNFTQVFNQLNGLNQSCTENFNTINQSIANFSNRVDNYMVWLNGTLVEMKSEISNTENMTIIINQSVTQILQYLNISTADLNLQVVAPVRCLVDTNWVAKAQVRDRFGTILSYLDGIQCNMTTDLWPVENMSYVFAESRFRYIHNCDPSNTTFNWSVNCGRT